MNWRPVIHSRSLAEIPEVFINTTRQRWKTGSQLNRCSSNPAVRTTPIRRGLWSSCGRREISSAVPECAKEAIRRFHTALLLDREGFDCRGQVHLFDDPNPLFVDGQPVRAAKDTPFGTRGTSWMK
jgi:hypothetical protein